MGIPIKFQIVAVLTLATAAGLGRAAPATPDPAVEKALAPFVASNWLAGAIGLCVGTNGEIRETCIGWANIGKKAPMRPDSLFWIASMSKTMCAAAVMMLVDEGKLSLDDPAGKYIPEFNNLWVLKSETNQIRTLVRPERPVTIRMLLAHTSGLAFLAPFQQGQGDLGMMPLAQTVQAYAQVPLLAQPGTKWSYSNEGVNTAARIVEIISGMTYDAFLQKRLFDPLGMKDATFFPDRGQISRLVTVYKYDTKTFAASEDTSRLNFIHPWRGAFPSGRYPEAGGGIYATADDVRRFAQMIINKGVFDGRRILSESAVAEIHKRQTPPGVKQVWGLCCHGSDGSLDDPLADFRKGGAYRTDMLFSPRNGLAFVWMVQQSVGPVNKMDEAERAFIRASKQTFLSKE